MVTDKKIAEKESKPKLRAKGSMDQPTGPKTRPPQFKKKKKTKKCKEQLVDKCILANSQVSSRVFNEGRSYFPDLRPKNIFLQETCRNYLKIQRMPKIFQFNQES